MIDRHVSLPEGSVRVRERGDGPPVVFVHGVLVDGRLWDGVVEHLGTDVRCIQPDLPLGAHRTPLRPGAELSAPQLIANLLEELDLTDVTLVGNDSGGAMCQMVAAYHPERVGRMILTNCDAYDAWPPDFFWPLFWAMGHVPGVTLAMAQTMRVKAVRHGPLGLGRLSNRKLDPALTRDWLEPLHSDAGVRRDLRKLIRTIDRQEMYAVADILRSFDGAVRLVWGDEDPFFPLALGKRIAAGIPGAELEEVAGARCFVPLEAPERVADAIRRVVAL